MGNRDVKSFYLTFHHTANRLYASMGKETDPSCITVRSGGQEGVTLYRDDGLIFNSFPAQLGIGRQDIMGSNGSSEIWAD